MPLIYGFEIMEISDAPFRQVKEAFDAADQRGLDALAVGDYHGLSAAIEEEKVIVALHETLLRQIRETYSNCFESGASEPEPVVEEHFRAQVDAEELRRERAVADMVLGERDEAIATALRADVAQRSSGHAGSDAHP